MKKIISAVLTLFPLLSYAVGYKIPEQSLRSTGTAGAYLSSANSADASYFNPANMVWIDSSFEIGLRYIKTSSQEFGGNVNIPFVGPTDIKDKTKSKTHFIPYFHFISKEWKGYKFGLSIATPAGLTKEWKGDLKTFAEKFGLKTIEINPSVARKISNNLSFAIGIRALYSSGDVRYTHLLNAYKNQIKGDSIDYGWNIAVAFKPFRNANISATYRSEINMTLKGTAKGRIGTNSFKSDVSVKAPIPAIWNIGFSYIFKEKTVFEVMYEKMEWSSYNKLDFDYSNAVVENAFGNPAYKYWKDINIFRIGIQHKINNKFTLLGGYSYNQNPVPEKTMSFDLPDGDSNVFSIGGIYTNGRKEFGLAVLYSIKKDRKVSNSLINNGEFKNNKVVLVNLSFGYKF